MDKVFFITKGIVHIIEPDGQILLALGKRKSCLLQPGFCGERCHGTLVQGGDGKLFSLLPHFSLGLGVLLKYQASLLRRLDNAIH